MLPEIQHYLERIEDLRGQVSVLITDLPVEALNWRPIEAEDDHATNSIAVLTTHLAGAEHFWIAEVIGRFPPTRHRMSEFLTQVASISELMEILDSTGQQTRTVLSALSPDDLEGTREAEGRKIPVRWAILHVIDHTALHLGHMQLTYQLWKGGKGFDAPRWYQRVPPQE